MQTRTFPKNPREDTSDSAALTNLHAAQLQSTDAVEVFSARVASCSGVTESSLIDGVADRSGALFTPYSSRKNWRNLHQNDVLAPCPVTAQRASESVHAVPRECMVALSPQNVLALLIEGVWVAEFDFWPGHRSSGRRALSTRRLLVRQSWLCTAGDRVEKWPRAVLLVSHHATPEPLSNSVIHLRRTAGNAASSSADKHENKTSLSSILIHTTSSASVSSFAGQEIQFDAFHQTKRAESFTSGKTQCLHCQRAGRRWALLAGAWRRCPCHPERPSCLLSQTRRSPWELVNVGQEYPGARQAREQNVEQCIAGRDDLDEKDSRGTVGADFDASPLTAPSCATPPANRERARDCDANAALVAWSVGPFEATRAAVNGVRGVELGGVASKEPLDQRGCSSRPRSLPQRRRVP